jgi:hypothetical protein
MAYSDTKPNGLMSTALALVTLAVFCLLFWAMFADAKTAECVTRARQSESDRIKIYDVRWKPFGGCQYLASIDKADKLWISQKMIMQGESGL